MYEIPSHFILLAKIDFNCNVTFEIRADESSTTIKTQTSYNWRLRWRRMQFELDRGGLQKTVFNLKNFSRQLVNNWVISRPLSVCFLFRTSGFTAGAANTKFPLTGRHNTFIRGTPLQTRYQSLHVGVD